MNDSDKEFEQRAKTALDSGVTNLDAATRSRLAAMRAQAFEHQPFWSRWLTIDHWMPAAAFATVAVLTATLLLLPSAPDAPAQLALQEGDMMLEVLFSENELEDVGDPDFYVWLDFALLEEEEPDHAG
jgi:hypothetical protein